MAGMVAAGCSVDAVSGLLRLSGGRRLRSPVGTSTRPTTARVREAVMNMLASELQDASWLDLCSGSGVMGCEAIERGVSRVWAVEKDPKTASVCRDNLMLIAGGRSPSPTVEVIRRDLVSWLQTGRPSSLPSFDVVYFDPPYDGGLYSKTLSLLANQEWLRPDGLLICEHPSDQPLDPGGQWTVMDRRRYGSSSLVMISRPERCRRDGTDSALHPYYLIAIGERVVGISDIDFILRRCGFFQYPLVGQVLNRESLSQDFEQPSMFIQSAQSVEITAGA